MSIWQKIFSWTPVGALFNGIKWLSSKGGPSITNSLTGAGLTAAEREANAFTAQQSELARQWQEDMYLKYESPAAMMAQYKEAGLNPALMYGDASSGSIGTTASAGSSVSPGGADLPGLFQFLMSAASLKSEIKLREAQAEAAKAGAGLSSAEADRAAAETERTKALTPLQINDLASQIRQRDSQISRNEAETALTYANLVSAQSDAKFRDRFNEINLRIAELDAQKDAQEIQNLKREFAMSFSREAEILANTEVLSRESANLLVQHGILEYNEDTAKYEASIKEFEDSKKNADRIWNNVGKGFGFFRDLGVGVGAVAAGAGRAAGAAVGGVVKSSSPILYGSDGKRVISSFNR